MPNKKITIKQILITDQSWWRFHEKYHAKIRIAIVVCIVKLLSCRNIIRGYHQYRCSNPTCSHVKYVNHTCKCKACSSCGKKATELWIQKQNDLLPKTSWQHIIFTMPNVLWDFFWHNRHLLNKISAIAADCIKTIARQKKVIPGIFIAIHTFGRDLKRNVHIHLSTTTGGLSLDLTQWKNIYFHQATLMQMWRYQIIQLFREETQTRVLQAFVSDPRACICRTILVINPCRRLPVAPSQSPSVTEGPITRKAVLPTEQLVVPKGERDVGSFAHATHSRCWHAARPSRGCGGRGNGYGASGRNWSAR